MTLPDEQQQAADRRPLSLENNSFEIDRTFDRSGVGWLSLQVLLELESAATAVTSASDASNGNLLPEVIGAGEVMRQQSVEQLALRIREVTKRRRARVVEIRSTVEEGSDLGRRLRDRLQVLPPARPSPTRADRLEHIGPAIPHPEPLNSDDNPMPPPLGLDVQLVRPTGGVDAVSELAHSVPGQVTLSLGHDASISRTRFGRQLNQPRPAGRAPQYVADACPIRITESTGDPGLAAPGRPIDPAEPVPEPRVQRAPDLPAGYARALPADQAGPEPHAV